MLSPVRLYDIQGACNRRYTQQMWGRLQKLRRESQPLMMSEKKMVMWDLGCGSRAVMIAAEQRWIHWASQSDDSTQKLVLDYIPALKSCKKSSKPIYVSVGHKISLETAVNVVRSCCKYRVPEPTRQNDAASAPEELSLLTYAPENFALRSRIKAKQKPRNLKIVSVSWT
ncbi:hypothetical protein AB205_0113990 [Aquarana catesbeiana]|uniref:Endonuclease V n=1 Tax=Aquarana catesbeiana TaxID=8400 RepID=A0A2G9RLW9_AQUCT|nr:hypothetical protein AB205_0113990 [Aquarana catesbeiana]